MILYDPQQVYQRRRYFKHKGYNYMSDEINLFNPSIILDEIAQSILSFRGNHPVCVAIDGKCCSGKTIFTNNLGNYLTSLGIKQIVRPSVDDFHNPLKVRYRQGKYSAKGYYQDTYNYPIIRDKLLKPIQLGPYPVHCQSACFDHHKDLAVNEYVEVRSDAILLFEGLFLMRTELNKFWDFRILLDISDELSVERAFPRDQELFNSREELLKKYSERYNPAWSIYVNEHHPEKLADVILDNSNPKEPVLKHSKWVK